MAYSQLLFWLYFNVSTNRVILNKWKTNCYLTITYLLSNGVISYIGLLLLWSEAFWGFILWCFLWVVISAWLFRSCLSSLSTMLNYVLDSLPVNQLCFFIHYIEWIVSFFVYHFIARLFGISIIICLNKIWISYVRTFYTPLYNFKFLLIEKKFILL